MFRNEPFRFGLIVFSACTLVSAAAVLAIWLQSTSLDFRDAYASGNCLVTREHGGAIIEWYCMPDGLRLAALALWCSAFCLGCMLFVRFASAGWQLGTGWTLLAIRMVIAPFMAGAPVFLEFYIIAYVLPYRAHETLALPIWAGIGCSAAVVSKSLFPRVNPLWLIVPIGLASIFGFAIISVVLGIVFD